MIELSRSLGVISRFISLLIMRLGTKLRAMIDVYNYLVKLCEQQLYDSKAYCYVMGLVSNYHLS